MDIDDFVQLKMHEEYLILEHIVKMYDMVKKQIIRNKKDYIAVCRNNKDQIEAVIMFARKYVDQDLVQSLKKMFDYYDDPTLRISISAYVQKFNTTMFNKKYTFSTFIDSIPCHSHYV